MTGPAFPFAIADGQVRTATEGDALRGRIVQVLFTAPGERVELPSFGCGLFDLVFEPNDELLATAAAFRVGEALTRWLGEEISIDGVDVSRDGPTVLVELAYTRRVDRAREALRLRFREGPAWTSG